ncbi:MAG: type II secretion system protein [Rubrivivax sp.]
MAGFTLVAVLILLGALTAAATAAGPWWSVEQQREREAELLRIGALYAGALKNYRDASPGSDRRYPASLDELLLDGRFVGTRRHLRRLYADPVRPGQPWGLIRDPQGGIRGVYSASDATPWMRTPVVRPGLRLQAAGRYRDWHFVATEEP